MRGNKYEIQKLHRAEFIVEKVLMLFAAVSVLTTAIIIFILFEETIVFFGEVPLWDFFTGTPNGHRLSNPGASALFLWWWEP